MDQRTRERLPVVPALVRTAERRIEQANRLLAATRSTTPGHNFTLDGQTFRRPESKKGGAGVRLWAIETDTGRRRDVISEEEYAFWSWAAIEVLRHTGVRIEELLELTHHSFVTYKLPDTGEIVPLLQITPSKLDKERLLLVTPELGEVLTAVIHRVRNGERPCPRYRPTTPPTRSGARQCRSCSNDPAGTSTARSPTSPSARCSTSP
jgi:hypothetical protein